MRGRERGREGSRVRGDARRGGRIVAGGRAGARGIKRLTLCGGRL